MTYRLITAIRQFYKRREQVTKKQEDEWTSGTKQEQRRRATVEAKSRFRWARDQESTGRERHDQDTGGRRFDVHVLPAAESNPPHHLQCPEYWKR